MGRTVAALAFIGVVAGAAIYLAQKPTIMKGSVMAADMVDRLREGGHDDVNVSCDDDTPIGVDGATFHCRFFGIDGSTATFRYFLSREGKLSGDLVESTGPTREVPRSGGGE